MISKMGGPVVDPVVVLVIVVFSVLALVVIGIAIYLDNK